jgi:hypothetical protein
LKPAFALIPVLVLVFAAMSGCIQDEKSKPASTSGSATKSASFSGNNTTHSSSSPAPTNSSATHPTNTTGPTKNQTGNATGNGTGDAYFFDNADTPLKTPWTFTNHYSNPADGSEVGTVNHQTAGKWHTSAKDKLSGTKSYTMQDEAKNGYHDNEYTYMTSPSINLMNATSAVLTFSYKGDSEANDYEGLYWLASTDGKTWDALGKQADKENNTVKAWKQVTVDLSKYVGKKVQIRFVFKSDPSCSVDSSLPSGLCGKGAFTGYFVDDIRVAPA